MASPNKLNPTNTVDQSPKVYPNVDKELEALRNLHFHSRVSSGQSYKSEGPIGASALPGNGRKRPTSGPSDVYLDGLPAGVFQLGHAKEADQDPKRRLDQLSEQFSALERSVSYSEMSRRKVPQPGPRSASGFQRELFAKQASMKKYDPDEYVSFGALSRAQKNMALHTVAGQPGGPGTSALAGGPKANSSTPRRREDRIMLGADDHIVSTAKLSTAPSSLQGHHRRPQIHTHQLSREHFGVRF